MRLINKLPEEQRKMIDLFLKTYRNELSRITIETYIRKGLRYINFCKENGLNFLEDESLLAYKNVAGPDNYRRARRFVELLKEALEKQGKEVVRQFARRKFTIRLKSGYTISGEFEGLKNDFIIIKNKEEKELYVIPKSSIDFGIAREE
ncbi:hypothetical protein [Desulfurobacterium sp.]